MATSFTYTTLKSAIEAFADDSGSELTTNIDTIIGLGEDALLKDLDLDVFEVIGTPSTSNSQLAKPTGTISVRSVQIQNSTFLEQRSYAFVKDYWPNSATTGTPKYFAEQDESNLLIAPTPSGSTTFSVRYTKRPDGLSGSTSTTFLSTKYGDLLLIACMVAAEQFLKGDERIPIWKADYVARVQAAKKEARQIQRDYFSPVAPTEKGSE